MAHWDRSSGERVSNAGGGWRAGGGEECPTAAHSAERQRGEYNPGDRLAAKAARASASGWCDFSTRYL